MRRWHVPSPRALLISVAARLRASYWAVPAALAAGALLLARLALHLDQTLALEEGDWGGWVYSGTAEGARTVLAALSGALITVSGVVFSITIVALSFASSHLGPRLLRNFMRDRVQQLVLGAFVATYLYSLAVLSSLRGGEESLFVPKLSITLAIGLAMLSFGLLIFFVHHVATAIQVGTALEGVRRSLRHAADALLEDGDAAARARADGLRELDPGCGEVLRSRTFGYVQVIDFQALAELAAEHDLRLACTRRAGHYVVEGGELLRLDRAPSAELASRLRSTFVLGPVRTEVGDLEFPIRQLVEVALRALSPGVNDPFTAITCIDHLSSGFAHLARKRMPGVVEHPRGQRRRRGAGDDRVRVHSIGIRFEEAMDAAWHPLRQHGASQVAVALRLLEALERIAAVSDDAHCLRAVLDHGLRIERASQEAVDEPDDRRALRERAERLRAACLRASGSSARPPSALDPATAPLASPR